ncbi:hypothetical protein B0H12DRAFT_1246765 [Mycena haematopus]|nr:hypothetical protein B0H12DRAFT_1246765 [Mycena haematopus]
MLWLPSIRKTRSSAVFAAWTGDIDFAPLLSRAVAAEGDDQADFEHEDEPDWLDGIDAENPTHQTHAEHLAPDPWNDVDDVIEPPAPIKKRQRLATSYDDCIATGKPLTGAHRRRKVRRLRRIEAEGHVSRASVLEEIVKPAKPIAVPTFDASTLPTARGAYSAKTERPAETHGSRRRRSVAELIGLGFQLIRWNGISPHPLVDSAGRIFAVLAGQPDNETYRAAVERAYTFIKQ